MTDAQDALHVTEDTQSQTQSNPREEVEEILKYLQDTKNLEKKLEEIESKGKEAIQNWNPCHVLINDAIHGPVQLNSLLIKIVDTPEFQRLRFIKQLGGGCYVYPGANHTRFDHSIGVCHIAGEFGHFLKNQIDEAKRMKKWPHESITLDEKEVLCLQIAGLCHDLGHGPFSHAFERVMDYLETEDVKLPQHEEISLMVFDRIMKDPEILAEFAFVYQLGLTELQLVKDMIHPTRVRVECEVSLKDRKKKQFLLEIVANKISGIDVDKWDYFTRDCHYLGIAMDFQWKRCMLLGRICKQNNDDTFHICFHRKELDNIYGMGHTRSTLYRKACVHKTKVAVEEMFAEAMRIIKSVPLIPKWNPRSHMKLENGTDPQNEDVTDFAGSSELQESETESATKSDLPDPDEPSIEVPSEIEKTLDLLPLNKAMKKAASDHDLRWFLSLTDVSVTTLIRNCLKINPEIYEQHKDTIEKAEKILNRIDHRQLYHLVVAERVSKSTYDLSKKLEPNATMNEQMIIEWNVSKLMMKEEDVYKETCRKQRLKNLRYGIFGNSDVDPNSVFVDIVGISFGSESKNDPVQDVLFYTPKHPFTAVPLDSIRQELGVEPSSLVRPPHFTEYEIRVYDTSLSSEQAFQDKVKEKFKNWKTTQLNKINFLGTSKSQNVP